MSSDDLFNALKTSLSEATTIFGARTIHFAFSDDGLHAVFLSEIEEEEAFRLIEDLIRRRRDASFETDGKVH